MKMTGTEKSFKAWAESHGVDIYFYRNTIRERSGVYSVTVPEIGLQWSGDAKDANEARILAVENYQKEKFDRQRGKRHLSHDWYVSQLFKAQKNKDTGLRKSLNYDLQRLSKFHRDAIMADFRKTYKDWYDGQSAMRRATTKNPRPPKSIRGVGVGPDKAEAQKWYGFGWNDARGGGLSNPPDNTYRGMYLKGYREYRPGQAPLLENPGGRFTTAQLSKLKKSYATIKAVDPDMPTYAALTSMLDTMTQAQLKQLHNARIKFVSGLAMNRIKRKGNPHMARKKPRTAKQRAATRKLIAFNKARRKKKPARRKTKKKTARRKTRRNPKIATGRRVKKTRARKSLGRGNFMVFRVSISNKIYWLGGFTAKGFRWQLSKIGALLMPKGKAFDLAKFAEQKAPGDWVYGAADAGLIRQEILDELKLGRPWGKK